MSRWRRSHRQRWWYWPHRLIRLDLLNRLVRPNPLYRPGTEGAR